MQIGVCVNFDEIDGISKKFKNLKQEGFDNCQLVSWKPELWTDENLEILKNLTEENGITISAFWCGWKDRLYGTFTTDR